MPWKHNMHNLIVKLRTAGQRKSRNFPIRLADGSAHTIAVRTVCRCEPWLWMIDQAALVSQGYRLEMTGIGMRGWMNGAFAGLRIVRRGYYVFDRGSYKRFFMKENNVVASVRQCFARWRATTVQFTILSARGESGRFFYHWYVGNGGDVFSEYKSKRFYDQPCGQDAKGQNKLSNDWKQPDIDNVLGNIWHGAPPEKLFSTANFNAGRHLITPAHLPDKLLHRAYLIVFKWTDVNKDDFCELRLVIAIDSVVSTLSCCILFNITI